MELIEIDGSYGEGGGQILRTSLTLSILTGKPLRIYRIRAGRKEPGLRPQHLMSAHAAAQISGGKLTGAELGSTELLFHPGSIRPGNYTLDVASVKASAGATTLIFQTIFLPLGFAISPSRIVLKGGTHVPWSPPADYIQQVFLPTVGPMGIQIKLKNPVKGVYPIGGGVLETTIDPIKPHLKPLRIQDRGQLKQIHILSTVANLPLSIAKRQLSRATALLTEPGLRSVGEIGTMESPGKGTFCFILAEFEYVRAGFSALGAIGKPAEQVADEAVEDFLRFFRGQGSLDPHLADQVVLCMALAEGESTVTVSEVTDHLKTNIWVIEQFLSVKFNLKEDPTHNIHNLHVTGIQHLSPAKSFP
jgi:RNA 3'-terminal phosphate cyclase (ATP)